MKINITAIGNLIVADTFLLSQNPGKTNCGNNPVYKVRAVLLMSTWQPSSLTLLCDQRPLGSFINHVDS